MAAVFSHSAILQSSPGPESPLGHFVTSIEASASTRAPATQKVVILRSPKAGAGGSTARVDRLAQAFRNQNCDVRVTDDPNQAGDGVDSGNSAAPADGTLRIAAGGDGTLNLLASLPRQPGDRFAAYPLGTENLIARHYGWSPDPETFAEQILWGEDRTIDAATLRRGKREREFLIMATMGFDAAIVRKVHLKRRGHISRSTYAWPIASSIPGYRFPTIEVTLDEHREFTCHWLMVFNFPIYAAKLAIEPEADPYDGKLDVVAFQGHRHRDAFRYFLGILTGGHRQFPDVIRTRASRIRWRCSPGLRNATTPNPIQCDGDYFARGNGEIVCRPKALTLRVPAAGNLM